MIRFGDCASEGQGERIRRRNGGERCKGTNQSAIGEQRIGHWDALTVVVTGATAGLSLFREIVRTTEAVIGKKIHHAKVLRKLRTTPTPEQVKKARAQEKRVDQARNRPQD
jgi:hypothetical protein